MELGYEGRVITFLMQSLRREQVKMGRVLVGRLYVCWMDRWELLIHVAIQQMLFSRYLACIQPFCHQELQVAYLT